MDNQVKLTILIFTFYSKNTNLIKIHCITVFRILSYLSKLIDIPIKQFRKTNK